MVLRRPSGFIEPCQPSKVDRPPSAPLWVHEIKYDGYRLMIRRDGSRVRCFTRGGYDWADRFPTIVDAALGKPPLALEQRQAAQAIAVMLQQVEGVQHGLTAPALAPQRMKVRRAVFPGNHRLAVDQERRRCEDCLAGPNALPSSSLST
jgi:hypothetical protein